MTIAQIAIDEIVVGERARRDYGDLSSLMDSIREFGILQPIGLAPGNHLLFGGRRLEAAKRLGMRVITITRPATQTDALSLLKAERDENTCRKDMTPEELVDLGLRLEELERPKAAARQGVRHDLATSGPVGPEVETSTTRTNRTAAAVAGALGISTNTYKRTKHVVTTARDEHEDPEVREVAVSELAKLNSGEASAYGAEQAVRKARKPRPDRGPRLALPQPPKYGGSRRKHLQIIEAMTTTLAGVRAATDEITELDTSVTSEEATRLMRDLSSSIQSLNRIRNLLKERTK